MHKSHNEAGYKLGHSINIMCNSVDSEGGARTDYANDYSQTGIKMPHMLTNGEQTDFLDKITLAQLEQATDVSSPYKLTHTTATGMMLMDYSGNQWGTLNDVSESSSFVFTEPIYQNVDRDNPVENPGVDNKKLSEAFDNVGPKNPLTLYSGYYSYNRDGDGLLNTNSENIAEQGNLYTYIYGWQYNSQMGSSHAGKDKAPDYITISDIDYDRTKNGFYYPIKLA